jgi:CubicO group peptidase (beta-lactamase class C family)
MRNYIYHQLKSICLLLFLLAGCLIHTIAQGFSPETKTRLQHVIDSFQNNPANPFIGGIAAAIKVDGLAFWQGTTGYAALNVDAQNNLLPGGTAFTTGTLSRIYSITKTFTAPLVLELAKEGVFGLDDSISLYFPFDLVNPGLNHSVTIRQLLAHESGYSDYTDELQLQIAVAFQPTHVWTPYETVSFVHQIAPPRTVRRYSSTNYIILGAIIEALTGKPIAQHFRERFFTPLSLNSMYVGVREPQPAGTVLAAPHDNLSPFNPIFQFTGQPTFPDAYTNVSQFPFTAIVSLAFTGGAIVSNVADVAEWGNALFTGKATSKETLDAMLNSIPSIPDEDGDYLGYGIWKSTRMSSTEKFIGHDGNAPGYRSVMFYQPEKKLTLVVLTNYHGADIYALARALYAAVPEFLCGNQNKKEDKIQLCFNASKLCVNRGAAEGLIKKGAFLGECSGSLSNIAKQPINEEQAVNDLSVFPNPSSDKVSISFKMPVSGPVTLRIYDMNGKLVTTLFNGMAEKGMVERINWNADKLPDGIYISRLQTVSGSIQRKIVLNR